eukprot:GILJ01001667.1.p1 GENE.GILJ01001667.1~~GILJ01001667.1.p1  ORF type:complete len:475 (+),score=55.24 GILJ01001667.1:41-1465(+)
MALLQPKIVILGAGPCGLGAATRLHELLYTNWSLYERSGATGGLASSMVDENGFTWDIGGHVIFSHYQYFDDVICHAVKEWNEMERESWVWMRDTWIPYPLQNNIWRLPNEDLLPCIDGILEAHKLASSYANKPANFREWLTRAFGKGLMDTFMLPYNTKVWAYPPEQMNAEWMGERVATVDPSRVVKNIVLKKDDIGWGPNAKFTFPLRGGSGGIWLAVAKHLPQEKLHLNKTVKKIDCLSKTISFADGSEETYDYIISTLPLDVMCKLAVNTGLDNLPAKMPEFRYSSTHVVGFGMEGQPPEHLKTKCWMYFPEGNCPFYRVTVFSNYSKYNVAKPGEQWSLMLEVSESSYKHVNHDTILQDCEQGCRNTHLIPEDAVIVTRYHTRLEYGYPTPFYGRDELCKPIFEGLSQNNILSRGRFGAWKYEVSNQDHSMMQGVEAVDHILFGTEELTFNAPGIVNAKKNPRKFHPRD